MTTICWEKLDSSFKKHLVKVADILFLDPQKARKQPRRKRQVRERFTVFIQLGLSDVAILDIVGLLNSSYVSTGTIILNKAYQLKPRTLVPYHTTLFNV